MLTISHEMPDLKSTHSGKRIGTNINEQTSTQIQVILGKAPLTERITRNGRGAEPQLNLKTGKISEVLEIL
jgi:hypothetical protein